VRCLCCVGACAASRRHSNACAASNVRPSPTRRYHLMSTSKSSSRLSRRKRPQTFRYVVVLFGLRRCLCCVAPVLCWRPACAVRGRVAAEAGWWASLRSRACHPLRAAPCAQLSAQGMAAVRAFARHSRRRAQPLASARARAFALPHAEPAEPYRRWPQHAPHGACLLAAGLMAQAGQALGCRAAAPPPALPRAACVASVGQEGWTAAP
jgi:hypothetical protein